MWFRRRLNCERSSFPSSVNAIGPCSRCTLTQIHFFLPVVSRARWCGCQIRRWLMSHQEVVRLVFLSSKPKHVSDSPNCWSPTQDDNHVDILITASFSTSRTSLALVTLSRTPLPSAYFLALSMVFKIELGRLAWWAA